MNYPYTPNQFATQSNIPSAVSSAAATSALTTNPFFTYHLQPTRSTLSPHSSFISNYWGSYPITPSYSYLNYRLTSPPTPPIQAYKPADYYYGGHHPIPSYSRGTSSFSNALLPGEREIDQRIASAVANFDPKSLENPPVPAWVTAAVAASSPGGFYPTHTEPKATPNQAIPSQTTRPETIAGSAQSASVATSPKILTLNFLG